MKVAGLGQGEISLVRKDHMVEDLNAHDLAGVHHACREREVFGAGCGIA